VSSLKRPIGIFGGTFDPVHYGHLRPALELYEGLGLAEVRFVPARQPPHRDIPGAAPEQRLALLHRALTGIPAFRVDTRELERPGPSYMVDTLTSLRKEVGDTPLCLMLGMDAFLGLAGWHRWQALAELAHIAVAHRPGWVPPEVGPVAELLRARASADPRHLAERPAGRVITREVTQLEISATAIRRLIEEGRDPRFLLPEAVLETIRSLGLYRRSS
jgi:nicotinate-nucleotide adenylyltransferase